MATRLRVGVIGCGVIAQVMHLHYLAELSDRFELVALCDAAEDVCAACAQDYRVPQRFTRWQDLLRAPIDAVLILTSGSHAPIAVAAAEAGLHVLVEKPLCFSVAEGRTMIAAAERAGVTLMVAYNKRYDPAWRRLVAEARASSSRVCCASPRWSHRSSRISRITDCTAQQRARPPRRHWKPTRRRGSPRR